MVPAPFGRSRRPRRARSAAVSQLRTALVPSGGVVAAVAAVAAPSALPCPRSLARLAVRQAARHRRYARALQRGRGPRCALARRSSARRRPRPCPDGRALRFAARALCFRSAAARAASRPGWPPARAPPAADACPSASPRRAPPLLGGLRAASRRPRSSLLRAGRGSGGPRARCRSLLYAGAGPAARRWLRRLSVRSLSAVHTRRY